MTDGGKAEDRARRLVDYGSRVAGGVAAGAVALIGGPPGLVGAPAVGVAVSEVFREVGAEIQQRVMSARQQARVGEAYMVIGDEINARLKAGEVLREDGFFKPESPEESDAGELLEGTLLQAANSYEERKVPYLANFYAALPFREDVSTGRAAFFLRLIERLTYGQIVMLALFGGREEQQLIYRLPKLLASDEPNDPMRLYELDDLASMGLVGYRAKGGDVVPFSATLGGGNSAAIKVSKVFPSEQGLLLYELMGLSAVPQSEQDDVLAAVTDCDLTVVQGGPVARRTHRAPHSLPSRGGSVRRE
jgi:hypothetical protein